MKFSRKYERFVELIRYLTTDELQQFFDSIDDYYHKIMFQVIYELGCRVDEFARIQVKHLNFSRSTVFVRNISSVCYSLIAGYAKLGKGLAQGSQDLLDDAAQQEMVLRKGFLYAVISSFSCLR